MANQVQLLLLLILTKSSLPGKVSEFITANLLTTFSFGFMYDENSFVGSPAKWFDEEQTDSELESIGVESHSSFTNIYLILL
jgi:hypothetical protein